MVFILKEEKALRIFENYRHSCAFSLSKEKKGVEIGDMTVTYEKLPFMLSEDEINGVKDGSIKLKKLIKKAVKALHTPARMTCPFVSGWA